MVVGKLFMTAGVQYEIEDGRMKLEDILCGFEHFKVDNFGLLCSEDVEYQNSIMASGDMEYPFMGSYSSNGIKFWIMNGVDQDLGLYTTVLLPDEY